tara:strand:+ start:11998 stop:12165 length:168 start_codon:yes stop_codon:yes gene_type:complete
MATKHRPEHHSQLQVESPMDYAQHEATYQGFIAGAKWSVIGLAVTLVILYFLIRP